MYNLLITVLTIALMAILVLGGVNYLRVDLSGRTSAEKIVEGESKTIEGAIVAYRLVNGGAMPPLSGWQNALAPYFPTSVDENDGGKSLGLNPPKGLSWKYGVGTNGVYWLCLANFGGANLSEVTTSGVVTASKKLGSAFVSNYCGEEQVPLESENFSMTFKLSFGG